jgi:hypothetical protein
MYYRKKTRKLMQCANWSKVPCPLFLRTALWDGRGKAQADPGKKQETTTEDLCIGFLEKFSKGLEYVRSLGFEDQPDYNHLYNLLSRVLGKAGEASDSEFD